MNSSIKAQHIQFFENPEEQTNNTTLSLRSELDDIYPTAQFHETRELVHHNVNHQQTDSKKDSPDRVAMNLNCRLDHTKRERREITKDEDSDRENPSKADLECWKYVREFYPEGLSCPGVNSKHKSKSSHPKALNEIKVAVIATSTATNDHPYLLNKVGLEND